MGDPLPPAISLIDVCRRHKSQRLKLLIDKLLKLPSSSTVELIRAASQVRATARPLSQYGMELFFQTSDLILDLPNFANYRVKLRRFDLIFFQFIHSAFRFGE